MPGRKSRLERQYRGRQASWRSACEIRKTASFCPTSPWLDGNCIEKGVIRQFVAVPLDRSITAEEQLTHESTCGWRAVACVFAMKIERAPKLWAKWEEEQARWLDVLCDAPEWLDLELAAGGRMQQAIYDYPNGIDAWDQEHGSRCLGSKRGG
jgi:hypothetical protein